MVTICLSSYHNISLPTSPTHLIKLSKSGLILWNFSLSFFLLFGHSNTKTISTLRRAEEFARQDLIWFTNDGIADTINVEIISRSRQGIDLNVEILANGDTIFKNTYEINWTFQLNDLPSERV